MTKRTTARVLFTEGGCGIAAVTVGINADGSLVATSEVERITKLQFCNFVRREFPDYEIVSEGRDGEFWRATGGKCK